MQISGAAVILLIGHVPQLRSLFASGRFPGSAENAGTFRVIAEHMCHVADTNALAKPMDVCKIGEHAKFYISPEELYKLLANSPFFIKALIATGAVIIACANPLSTAALGAGGFSSGGVLAGQPVNRSSRARHADSTSRLVRGRCTDAFHRSRIHLCVLAERRSGRGCSGQSRCWRQGFGAIVSGGGAVAGWMQRNATANATC